ncbi:hypothetical protein [Streptomyces sp. NPDC087294]|uniref:hypothetical protein n=1 Tax=Streptomyces sp. NPDC087294 TaxID=3365777 RepID=UPI00382B8CEE
MLNAVSGPREVAGVSVSDGGRRQIIDLFKRAGLTEGQAVTIVDLGVLPTSLASANPTAAVTAQLGRMDPAVKAALATLKPESADRETSKDELVVSTSSGEGALSRVPTPAAQSDSGEGAGSLSTIDQGRMYTPESTEGVSDALGDLVEALNPFQGWGFAVFRVPSTVVPSVPEETGEVKVTVTTETEGVTVTTEITKPVDGEASTLVTQATDTGTGEALSNSITAQAPSVDTVSAVAFGQLAKGYHEAKAERQESGAEAAAKAAVAAPGSPSTPQGERPAEQGQTQAQGGEVSETAGAASEASQDALGGVRGDSSSRSSTRPRTLLPDASCVPGQPASTGGGVLLGRSYGDILSETACYWCNYDGTSTSLCCRGVDLNGRRGTDRLQGQQAGSKAGYGVAGADRGAVPRHDLQAADHPRRRR